MEDICIQSLEHLKKLCGNKEEYSEFYILLSGGLFRSSKRIFYGIADDLFSIINEIDDTEQEVLSENLAKETIIVEAISKKAMFMYQL